jgi:SOS response regulatory protein OraA/RecX
MTTGSLDGRPAFDGAELAAREQALQKALDLAYAYVNRRERTVAEVRSQLERKGVSDADADAAVATLLEQHLLDDERFAELFVSDKRELEQWGRERIQRGLSARGIDRELAERALTAPGLDAIDDDDARGGEMARALALLRRRFPEPPRERRDRDRALGMLFRKGYEHELAIDALNAHAREQ